MSERLAAVSPLRDFDAGAKDSALLAVVGAFLRPVDLLALRVDSDADAPSGLVAPIGVATAGLDERLDLRSVEIRAHHAHSFAVAPVELAVLLIELDLFRRERAALWNDHSAITAVDVGALDGAIVCAGTGAHVRPVDMAGRDIDRDAIRKTAIGDDDLPVGAVGIHRMNAAGAQLEHEKAAGGGFARRVPGLDILNLDLRLFPFRSDRASAPRARYATLTVRL